MGLVSDCRSDVSPVTILILILKKICVLRVTTPKKLGRIGRDFFFFNECGLFCKRHLSRYDHIRVTLIKEINLISRNQLSSAKSTYKNIILNNYAKILPEC